MYNVYFGRTLCPVPTKIKVKINNNNHVVTLIDDGDINILKKAGLTEIDCEMILPNVRYPFARYNGRFKNAEFFLDELERLKLSQKPFQFIVTRSLPNGIPLYDTNISVSIEDYELEETGENGFDVTCRVSMKQYKPYGTKTCQIVSNEAETVKVIPQAPRETSTSPKPQTAQTYTVKKGDCLWNIAKKYYGNGSQYPKIYNANKDKIKNPNLIYPGQVLIIPK